MYSIYNQANVVSRLYVFMTCVCICISTPYLNILNLLCKFFIFFCCISYIPFLFCFALLFLYIQVSCNSGIFNRKLGFKFEILYINGYFKEVGSFSGTVGLEIVLNNHESVSSPFDTFLTPFRYLQRLPNELRHSLPIALR